jgi:hypothetical protein
MPSSRGTLRALSQTRSSQRFGLAAIISVVVAYAVMVQGPGWNQNAHYALTRAISSGTPTIDRTQFETGPWYRTGDITFFKGHYYSAKAPGLAFASLPPYLPMKGLGVWNTGDSTRMLWFLGLWTVILPAALMLFLVRQIGDRLQPGSGTVAAVTLGVGTLVLPFSTMLFAHLLSAALGFAAFALLWHEREGPARLQRVAVAGLLAGLATTTEYPLALVAAFLGLYAVSRRPIVERGLAYAGGGVLGVLPLLLYQWWAFGSPTHFAYQDVVGGLNQSGTFGVNLPHFRVAMDLLFSNIGLLRLSPVLALAVLGIVFLYRQGRRADAFLIAAIGLAYLIYNAGYETPFGGNSPGPRFLIAILPFLALAIGPVFARLPVTTLLLAAPSAVLMVAVTATHPIENWDGQWFQRIGDGNFSATLFGLFGTMPLDALKLPSSAHWYPLLLLLVPILFALAMTAAERPPFRVSGEDVLSGTACLVGWLVVQHEAPRFLTGQRVGTAWAPLVVLLLAVAVAVFAIALPAVFPTGRASLGEGESSRA